MAHIVAACTTCKTGTKTRLQSLEHDNPSTLLCRTAHLLILDQQCLQLHQSEPLQAFAVLHPQLAAAEQMSA